MKLNGLATVMLCAMVLLSSVCQGALPVGEHAFTTDKGLQVYVAIAPANERLGKILQLTPTIREKNEANTVRQATLEPCAFAADRISTLRVSDWLDDGIICAWTADVGDHYEYRWATWNRGKSHTSGQIPATDEMRSRRFMVQSVLNRRYPSDDGFEVTLEGEFEDRSRRRLWYWNACGSVSSERNGDLYQLDLVRLKTQGPNFKVDSNQK